MSWIYEKWKKRIQDNEELQVKEKLRKSMDLSVSPKEEELNKICEECNIEQIEVSEGDFHVFVGEKNQIDLSESKILDIVYKITKADPLSEGKLRVTRSSGEGIVSVDGRWYFGKDAFGTSNTEKILSTIGEKGFKDVLDILANTYSLEENMTRIY